MTTALDSTFPHTTCMPWTAAAEVTAQLQQERSWWRQEGQRTAQPLRTPSCSEHDTSPHSPLRHSLGHAWANLPPVAKVARELDCLLSPGQAVTPCQVCHWSCTRQEHGEETRAGRGGLCWCLWSPFCGAASITTRSRTGNKDMISSGAHFLGALKDVAGKIWSTVIMEEGKDRRVAGRAPGPGILKYLRKGILARTIALTNYPWCLSRDYHCSLGKERGWGGQTLSIPYQSAVLRKSDLMEEKVNLVSMVTEVWKKYLAINVMLTHRFMHRPTATKSYSIPSIRRPCNHHETIQTRAAVSSSCAWFGTTVSPPGETLSR